jgi:hypothetical protein
MSLPSILYFNVKYLKTEVQVIFKIIKAIKSVFWDGAPHS